MEPLGTNADGVPVWDAKERATVKFTIEAGILVRGAVISSIRHYCFIHGLDYQIKEDRGWLRSVFYIKLIGADPEIEQAEKDFHRLALKMGWNNKD